MDRETGRKINRTNNKKKSGRDTNKTAAWGCPRSLLFSKGGEQWMGGGQERAQEGEVGKRLGEGPRMSSIAWLEKAFLRQEAEFSGAAASWQS